MKFNAWIIPLAGMLMLAGPGGASAGDPDIDPCPNSPNCVSTKADSSDAKHYMAPLDFSGDGAQAMEKLAAIISAMPRTEIVAKTDKYIHAVFSSKIFKFKDDVEILVDEEANQIHFRSASRTGYSDFGMNKKRMEEICAKFKQ
ncbi:DUF1499 domain-containing protein [Desulfatibacillum aliphaticivorans]|uniref:DUF1499 domain-containing protein n=1 Tax=Desulfatibacillum aliphaticivorans TaxID=218208 RepID=UPI000407E2CD|nr:DUF1499 domain-containing protein [Desulfatibacillum aliphaticivorans]